MKNPKAFLGIVMIVVGAIMLVFSNYIANQVTAGKFAIQSGQNTIDNTNSLFSTTKATKPIGEMFTSSGQQRVDAGRAEVSKYESISHNLQLGGIALIVVGIGLLIWSRKK
jgi:ABC-type transport system involved in multi-copper enzyme maturation permease subunit